MFWDIASVRNSNWQCVVVFNGRVTGRLRCRMRRDGALVMTAGARFINVARIVRLNVTRNPTPQVVWTLD
eukprot:4994473-Pyramimonas_sp.AAC.2